VTVRIGNVVIVAVEEPQQCDACGETDELRPYGVNGRCICWKCAEKSEVRCGARMMMILYDTPRREGIQVASDWRKRRIGNAGI